MACNATLGVMPVRNGYGIVAAKPFRRGSLIFEIRGKIVTAEQVWRYWDADPRLGENCFRYDADHYLDPDGELGQYANHSCRPNAGIVQRKGRLMMKAIASIATGEEITHDYSTLLGADDVWKMRCNCGEGNCRGIIANVRKLPARTLRTYRRLGIIPEFILATKQNR